MNASESMTSSVGLLSSCGMVVLSFALALCAFVAML